MIGIFDSGLGGLTVFKAVSRQLPGYSLLYFGDTARTPYGNRSPELIYQFTVSAVNYLCIQGCELIIIACNTASAEALRRVQQEWLPKHFPDRRVLGVIRPIVEVAVEQSKHGRIGVVGTRGTIASNAYERELKNIRSDVAVFQQACPLLVPLVEEDWIVKSETRKIVRAYLRAFKDKQIDTLILGCTHYPFLHKTFQAIVGRRVNVLQTDKIVAQKLADYLQRHPELESRLDKTGKRRIVVTDKTERFVTVTNRWLGEVVAVEQVNIE